MNGTTDHDDGRDPFNAPGRITCDACHKPIKRTEAQIWSGTSKNRERWHIGCCPWLRRAPVEIAEPEHHEEAAAA